MANRYRQAELVQLNDNDSNDKDYLAPPSDYEKMMTGCGNTLAACGIYCCALCPPYKEVKQGEIGLVTKFGRFEREVGSGLTYINPCTERLETVSARLAVFDLERQHVTTKDNLSVSIDCVLGYRVTNAQKLAFTVSNPHEALKQFCYTTLRHVIGNMTLQECLGSREQICTEVKALVVVYADSIGARIETIGFKDMIIPKDTQQAISSAAIARREAESQAILAEANLVVARKNAEIASEKARGEASARIIIAKADVETSRLMSESAAALGTPEAMQIKALAMMTDMFKNQGSGTRTFFFPSNMPTFGANLVNNSTIDVHSNEMK